MGIALLAFFAAAGPLRSHDEINIKMNELRGKLGQALLLLFCKTILETDILAFHPSKLIQLLPQRINQNRATGLGGDVQITEAKHFSGLLRLDRTAKRKGQNTKDKDSDFSFHVFPCSLHSTLFTRPPFI